MYAKKIIER